MKRTATATSLAPVPRDIRLTAGGKTVMAIAIVLAAGAVAAAIGLTVLRAYQQAERDLMMRDGVRTDASVTRIATTRGEDPRTVVTYRYLAADGMHEGETRLRKKSGRVVAEGDRIAIVYLRSQPGRNWLPGREPGVFPLWLVPMIAAALLALACVIAGKLHRDRRLLSEGRLAQARIVAAAKSHAGYRVQYEFTILSGRTMKTTVERSGTPGPAGSMVPVIYHCENPKWSAFYPMALVTPSEVTEPRERRFTPSRV